MSLQVVGAKGFCLIGSQNSEGPDAEATLSAWPSTLRIVAASCEEVGMPSCYPALSFDLRTLLLGLGRLLGSSDACGAP